MASLVSWLILIDPYGERPLKSLPAPISAQFCVVVEELDKFRSNTARDANSEVSGVVPAVIPR
jgi:hypothetical protein